jgi:hypothetical protein
MVVLVAEVRMMRSVSAVLTPNGRWREVSRVALLRHYYRFPSGWRATTKQWSSKSRRRLRITLSAAMAHARIDGGLLRIVRLLKVSQWVSILHGPRHLEWMCFFQATLCRASQTIDVQLNRLLWKSCGTKWWVMGGAWYHWKKPCLGHGIVCHVINVILSREAASDFDQLSELQVLICFLCLLTQANTWVKN